MLRGGLSGACEGGLPAEMVNFVFLLVGHNCVFPRDAVSCHVAVELRDQVLVPIQQGHGIPLLGDSVVWVLCGRVAALRVRMCKRACSGFIAIRNAGLSHVVRVQQLGQLVVYLERAVRPLLLVVLAVLLETHQVERLPVVVIVYMLLWILVKRLLLLLFVAMLLAFQGIAQGPLVVQIPEIDLVRDRPSGMCHIHRIGIGHLAHPPPIVEYRLRREVHVVQQQRVVVEPAQLRLRVRVRPVVHEQRPVRRLFVQQVRVDVLVM